MAGGGPTPALPTATIGGTLYHSTNTPAAHRAVAVQLLRDFAVLSVDSVVYYDRPATIIRKTTDTNGSVTFEVPVPPTGTVPYKITFPNGSTYTVNLASGDYATFDDIVEAVYSTPDPSTLSANILAGLLNAEDVSADNPFVTLSQLGGAGVSLEQLKDYSYPADATLVDPAGSGDYSQLSVALAEIGATASSNKRKKIVVRGPITEETTVQAQNYVDVWFQEQAVVNVNGSTTGPAVQFNAISDPDLVWQAMARRAAKFLRTGGAGTGFNYGLEIINPQGVRPTIRGIVFATAIHMKAGAQNPCVPISTPRLSVPTHGTTRRFTA